MSISFYENTKHIFSRLDTKFHDTLHASIFGKQILQNLIKIKIDMLVQYPDLLCLKKIENAAQTSSLKSKIFVQSSSRKYQRGRAV